MAARKPPDIQFLQADEEEEYEDADAQDDLDLGARLHQSGHGAEDNPRGCVGDDRVQAEPLEYALQQLGDNDEQTYREKGFMEFQSAMSSLAVCMIWRRCQMVRQQTDSRL